MCLHRAVRTRLGLLAIVMGLGLSAAALSAAAPQDRPLPRWTPEDHPAVPRITAFGTSLTARGTWPDALAETLGACLGRDMEVARVAQSGKGSTWAFTQLDAVVATQPDLVLMEFAINDADIRDGLWLEQSRDMHLQIIEALQRRLPGVRVLLMTMNPVKGMVRHGQRPRLRAYYAMVRDLAGQTGSGLADFTPRWQEHGLVAADGLHPDPAMATQLMVPVLSAMVARALGQSCPG